MRSASIPNSTVSQLISKMPGYRAHSVDDCHAEQCSPVLRGGNTATCAIPPALTFRPKWRKFGGSKVRPPAKIVGTVQGSLRQSATPRTIIYSSVAVRYDDSLEEVEEVRIAHPRTDESFPATIAGALAALRGPTSQTDVARPKTRSALRFSRYRQLPMNVVEAVGVVEVKAGQ
jgi:hypothetical protein